MNICKPQQAGQKGTLNHLKNAVFKLSDFSSSEERNSSTWSLVPLLWPLTLQHRSWDWSWGLSECHWRCGAKTGWTANAPVLPPGPWKLIQQWRWHTLDRYCRGEAEVKVHDTTQTMKAEGSINPLTPLGLADLHHHSRPKMWPRTRLFTRHSFLHLTNSFTEL